MLKLVLGLFAAVFAISLLAGVLILMLVNAVISLLTGRKPAPAVIFRKFGQFQAQDLWARGAPRDTANGPGSGDIVDVEVREVRNDRHLP